MKRLAIVALGLLAAEAALCAARLLSGPMVGAALMAEVHLWVQTDVPAAVQIRYWDRSAPEEIFLTEEVRTEQRYGYVAKLVADRVLAGRQYGYAVWIDGKAVAPRYRDGYRDGEIELGFHTPPNWRFREAGHALVDFTVGFGSCAYFNQPEGGYDRMGGNPYGGGYQIFESIYEVKPDLFIWLGDSIYYREPDWTSRTGMIHRWSYARRTPHLRPMLATIPQYATWDDHDYGPNDAGREFWNRPLATEIFELFWANPSGGLPSGEGVASYFAWGDVHFYLLDNRTWRTTPGLDPEPFGYASQVLGKEQIDWVVELMKYNRTQSASSYPCSFHVVGMGNQVFSPHSADSLRNYPREWQYLLDRLAHEEIHNVIFITGDVHFGEVSRYEHPSGVVFWEVTSSSLTAGSWAGADASRNPDRFDIFPGETDRVGQRNFATLSFEGPLPQRRAVIRYYDVDGNLLNQDPGSAPGVVTPQSTIHARGLVYDERMFR